MIAVHGYKNEHRTLAIVLGQSKMSKGVMFVLYSIPKFKHIPPTFLGILSSDLDKAIEKAAVLAPTNEIQVWNTETVADRIAAASANNFPFGKYKGKSVQEIFELDPQYIWWASSNCTFSQKGLQLVMNEYKELARDFIISQNKEKSQPALVEGTVISMCDLKIYKEENLGKVTSFKFKDASGNLYTMLTSKPIADINNCIVTGNYSTMGLIFNKIKAIK